MEEISTSSGFFSRYTVSSENSLIIFAKETVKVIAILYNLSFIKYYFVHGNIILATVVIVIISYNCIKMKCFLIIFLFFYGNFF